MFGHSMLAYICMSSRGPVAHKDISEKEGWDRQGHRVVTGIPGKKDRKYSFEPNEMAGRTLTF